MSKIKMFLRFTGSDRDGHETEIEVDPTWKFEALRDAILEVTGPIGTFRLAYSGKQINPGTSLSSLKLQPGRTIFVLLQLRGGSRPALDSKKIQELKSYGFGVETTEGNDDLYDSETPRIIMPCGHKFSPTSLRGYLDAFIKKESSITPLVCPFVTRKSYTCLTKRWEWEGVCTAALLTTTEMTDYERYLTENLAIQEMGGARCPDCKTVAYRTDKTKRVVCGRCEKKKAPNSEFCAACGRKWRGSSCMGCLDINTELKECGTKVVSEMTVPTIRMCPRPHLKPVLMEHDTACKHMMCPACSLFFCFGCLSLPSDTNLSWGCGGAFSACPKGVAARQQV